MKTILIILFSSFTLLMSGSAAVRDTSIVLTEAQWERLTSGKDYTERFKTPEIDSQRDNESFSTASQQYTTDMKYFIYALVAVVLIVIIVLLIRNSRSKANPTLTTTSVETVMELEQDVHELDLEVLLKEALEKGNYRLALRIQFLMIIKALSLQGKITWAKEKTNWEYHLELKEKLIADRFREIVIEFESFWYGEHELNEQSYYRAEPLYKDLMQKLRPNE